MRVCLVYDCLFPYTIGGAERWYRNLGQRLAGSGHEVTYLTLRQWERGTVPEVPGVRVVAVGPRLPLYAGRGRRRVLPPIVFGVGVLVHLLRFRRRYDVVHMASFPYFSLLAAALARSRGGFRLIVDWHEVWSRSYWQEYLGRLAGALGWLVQRACIHLPQRAFCFSRLHAERLRSEGFSGEITVLPGEWEGPIEPAAPRPPDSLVVFAGRHIPEKRVLSIPSAVLEARRALPGLRATILGDGPDRPQLVRMIRSLGLEQAIEAPGFVPGAAVEDSLARALCLLLPSRREGYGLVVLEAASRGTPSIVVAEPDNAAVELVEENRNGLIVASASPQDLAAAITRISREGHALRERTAAWFAENAPRRSLTRSSEIVARAYADE